MLSTTLVTRPVREWSTSNGFSEWRYVVSENYTLDFKGKAKGPLMQRGKDYSCPTLLSGDTGQEVAPSFSSSYLTEPVFNLPVSIPRCSDGMVVVRNCTPWSDLQCVSQESSNQTTGEAPIPGESVTSPGPPTTPSPSSGSSQLVLGIVLGTVCVLLLSACAYYHRRRIFRGEVGGMLGRRCHSLLPLSLPAVSQTDSPSLHMSNPCCSLAWL